MNKAFVKEPEQQGGICPGCQSLGVPVGFDTLAAMLRPEALASIAKSAFFCEYQRCEIAYFDAFDQFVKVAALRHPVWPKDPTAPLCGCFGLTVEDVEADVLEGGVRRVRDVVLRSKTDAASCLTKSPTGQSCAAAVQRCYFRLRERGST